MGPKKRTASKNPLSRGRQKKGGVEVGVSATSDSDVASEQPSSHGDSQPESSPDLSIEPKDPIEATDDWKELEGVNLIDDLRAGPGRQINYITDTTEHRDLELRARKRLLEMQHQIDDLINTFNAALRTARNMRPEAMNSKVCDVIQMMDSPPITFEELFKYVIEVPSPTSAVPEINIDAIPEEDEEEDVVAAIGASVSKKRVFPTVDQAVPKFCTPKNQKHVFQFGTNSKAISTGKSARLAKPGEVVFSQSGSPILLRKILDHQQHAERIEVVQPDGSKMEVDIVYRGGKAESSKLRGFKEFTQEIRGMAASRATTARQNRVAPPRIIKAPHPQSASKPKPEWR